MHASWGKVASDLDVKYGDFTEKLEGEEIRAMPVRRKVNKAGKKRL